jgi:ribosomal protein S21
MNFGQIVFSGNNFKKIVTKNEIIAYSRDYDKYREAFLIELKRIQADANGRRTT